MNNQQAINLLKGLEKNLDDYCGLNDEGKTAFGMAISALNCSEIPNNWIPCSVRLPEDDTEVLVYLFENNKSPYIAWLSDGRWYTEYFEVEQENEPVAWMSLPKPWKGEEDEND